MTWIANIYGSSSISLRFLVDLLRNYDTSSKPATSGEGFRDIAAVTLSLYEEANPEQTTDLDDFLRVEKQAEKATLRRTSAETLATVRMIQTDKQRS